MESKIIKINEVEYIRKDSINQEMPEIMGGKEYCLIRTYSAGVFAGYIDRKLKGKERTIYHSRRIWKWEGAASLSQMAMEGVKKPDGCKFACKEPKKDLTEIIEILPCTEEAKISIEGVKEWKV